MIPEGFITQLLDRADIVDVIGRYVPLKKAGRNLMACCPFHQEKTPSFSVSPTKQFFKCFGCGAGGNAIGFLMRLEGLEFPEAVEKLAAMYHMEVPKTRRSAKEEREQARGKSLTELMAEAARFYTDKLRASEKAVNYLKGRGIDGATAAKFALGYSPEGWHALQTLFGERYVAPELVECGLVNVKNDRRYDAYRDRLMFPIRNTKGQVIGFGARTFVADEQPKYLNSPETPIYHKGRELYGLFEGREAVHRKGRAIVCEGYMDVIQLSQAGFEESVAALGTSITSEHVQKLFKIADRVYFSFDGDGAGRKAARRALEAALPVIADGQRAHFVLLPPQHDPDSLIKAEGAQAFERELEHALGLVDFAKSVLTADKELAYAEERAKVVAEGKQLCVVMTKAPVLRRALMEEIAAVARLTVDEIERQYGLASPAPVPRPPVNVRRDGAYWARREGGPARAYCYGRFAYAPSRREPRPTVVDCRERVLQCFLAHPQLIEAFDGRIEELFLSSEQTVAREIVEVWRTAWRLREEGERSLNPAGLLSALATSDSVAHYEALIAAEMQMDTPEEGARLELASHFLMLELEENKWRRASMTPKTPDDYETYRKLLARSLDLQRFIRDAQAAEQAYRNRCDVRAAFEQNKLRESREGHAAGAMRLDANPKVRALQAKLFGLTPDAQAPARAVEEPRAPVLAGALGQLRRRRDAEDAPPLAAASALEPAQMPETVLEGDLEGMAREAAFDDEAWAMPTPEHYD